MTESGINLKAQKSAVFSTQDFKEKKNSLSILKIRVLSRRNILL